MSKLNIYYFFVIIFFSKIIGMEEENRLEENRLDHYCPVKRVKQPGLTSMFLLSYRADRDWVVYNWHSDKRNNRNINFFKALFGIPFFDRGEENCRENEDRQQNSHFSQKKYYKNIMFNWGLKISTASISYLTFFVFYNIMNKMFVGKDFKFGFLPKHGWSSIFAFSAMSNIAPYLISRFFELEHDEVYVYGVNPYEVNYVNPYLLKSNLEVSDLERNKNMYLQFRNNFFKTKIEFINTLSILLNLSTEIEDLKAKIENLKEKIKSLSIVEKEDNLEESGKQYRENTMRLRKEIALEVILIQNKVANQLNIDEKEFNLLIKKSLDSMKKKDEVGEYEKKENKSSSFELSKEEKEKINNISKIFLNEENKEEKNRLLFCAEMDRANKDIEKSQYWFNLLFVKDGLISNLIQEKDLKACREEHCWGYGQKIDLCEKEYFNIRRSYAKERNITSNIIKKNIETLNHSLLDLNKYQYQVKKIFIETISKKMGYEREYLEVYFENIDNEIEEKIIEKEIKNRRNNNEDDNLFL